MRVRLPPPTALITKPKGDHDMKKLTTLLAAALLAASHAHALDVNAYQLDAEGNRITPVASGSTQSVAVITMPVVAQKPWAQAVAEGVVSGYASVNKFGSAPDFDQDEGEITVWDGADDGTAWELMRYVYSTSADIDSISSSSNADSNSVLIIGLDSSSNQVSQTVTLLGTNSVPLTTSLYRVFRAYNNNGPAFIGHVIVYVNTALTAGVPTDKNKIRLVIQPENQQTEMALYTIPAGKTGYIDSIYIATGGSTKIADYVVRLYATTAGGVPLLKHKSAVIELGASGQVVPFKFPLSFAAGTDIEVTVEIPTGTADKAAFIARFSVLLKDD